MSSTEKQLIEEFTTLRYGWALSGTGLGNRVGPTIRRLCGIQPDAEDRDIRRLVLPKVKQLSKGLSAQDRRSIAVALGAESGTQLPRLAERIQLLASENCVSARTARRMVFRAFELLAGEAADSLRESADSAADPEQGWYVRSFEALLRLDTPAPELIEERTIVSLRDGLKRITVRFSLPKRLDDDESGYALAAEVQHGARIESGEELGEGHFRFVLALSKTLREGDEHTYSIIFRVPRDQPIRPYYAFVPLLAPCESFRVRIRFDPLRLPKTVWRIHRLTSRILANRPVPGEPLVLDDADEVELDFQKLVQGYGYGVGWLPS
jgi:hypothetical protein